MLRWFLIISFISYPAYAGQCDQVQLQCMTYYPQRQSECFALAQQCKQQEQMNDQLREMNQRQRLDDDDSLLANAERFKEKYGRH